MNAAMMNKLKKMKQEMDDAQQAIEESIFIGKASGVTCEVQGTKAVISIKIDPELLDEVEILQDAICIAINDAIGQIEAKSNELMGQFNMPGGFGF